MFLNNYCGDYISGIMNSNIEKSFEFFLHKDFYEYKDNEWLAICGHKIIAHGENLKEVIKKASTSCSERPLFTRVKKTACYL